MPIADSKPPMVVGIRHTSSATSTVSVTTVPAPALATAYCENGSERRRREQEDERQHREQDRERDLVRRAAALRALDHRDHAIEEALALAARDAHDEPVRQHARAARDATRSRRPLSRSTGADSPVTALSLTEATPSTTSPSAGIVSLASTSTRSPRLQRARLDGLDTASRSLPSKLLRVHVPAHRAQRRGLRLAAPFGHGLGEIREQHREPQPGRDREHEAGLPASATRAERAARPMHRREACCRRSTTNITGLRNWTRGSSFANDARIAAADDRRDQRSSCARRVRSCVQLRYSCVNLCQSSAGARRSGPSASAGTNVSAPTIRTTPTSIDDEQRRVRRQRAGRHGRSALRRETPAIASTGIMSQ